LRSLSERKTPVMNASQAQVADTLMELKELRQRTRSRLDDYWFPLVVFGALSIASAPFSWLLDGAAMGLFWLVAAPAGSVAVSVHCRRRELSLGLGADARPYLLTASGIFVVAMAAVTLGGAFDREMLAAVGPPLAVSAGYLIFGHLVRSHVVTTLALGLAGMTILLELSDLSQAQAGSFGALVYGVCWLLLGVCTRLRQDRA
jgi:hypothetical protein